MAIRHEDWNQLRSLAGRVLGSSLHFTIATVNSDGTPHVAPIGSLILTEPGEGYFFELFARQLSKNLDNGSKVAVLGVNSSGGVWLRSLLSGRFRQPPAFRLLGEAGERRSATAAEQARWRRKVRLLRWTRGYDALWANLYVVRELRFHELQAIQLGQMTSELEWVRNIGA